MLLQDFVVNLFLLVTAFFTLCLLVTIGLEPVLGPDNFNPFFE